MQPHVNHVEDTLRPGTMRYVLDITIHFSYKYTTLYWKFHLGITMLTWSSISLDDYVSKALEEMNELELLIERINNLCTYRIDAVLKEMGKTLLCELPHQAAWAVDEFLSRTEAVCISAGLALNTKSKQIEKATTELIDMIMTYKVGDN